MQMHALNMQNYERNRILPDRNRMFEQKPNVSEVSDDEKLSVSKTPQLKD